MFQFRDDVTEARHDRPPRGRPSVERAPELDDMEEAMSAVHGAMEADPATPILATMISPDPGVVAQEEAPDASFHTPVCRRSMLGSQRRSCVGSPGAGNGCACGPRSIGGDARHAFSF